MNLRHISAWQKEALIATDMKRRVIVNLAAMCSDFSLAFKCLQVYSRQIERVLRLALSHCDTQKSPYL